MTENVETESGLFVTNIITDISVNINKELILNPELLFVANIFVVT